jgi:hypothetical protein
VLFIHPSCGREQNKESCALWQLQYFTGGRFGRVAFDRFSALFTKGPADAGKQQSEVIKDLGLRGYGRAGIASRVLLPNRDRRTDAKNLIDIRLVHSLEELSRICRQALDVAPLAFGVDGVEGEAGLA